MGLLDKLTEFNHKLGQMNQDLVDMQNINNPDYKKDKEKEAEEKAKEMGLDPGETEALKSGNYDETNFEEEDMDEDDYHSEDN